MLQAGRGLCVLVPLSAYLKTYRYDNAYLHLIDFNYRPYCFRNRLFVGECPIQALWGWNRTHMAQKA